MALLGFTKKILGSRNERLLKKYQKIVSSVNLHEKAMQQLSDSALSSKTNYFKKELQAGKSLDDILPEAFAVVREVGKRCLGMRHFDVQLIGGLALHYGKIAEMGTGEGKTLVATLPAYVNALTGDGVHIVTVNDYLAMRDANWMRPIYETLGLKVGIITHGMSKEEKREAYSADIVYGTNNEFGFDYLRDNMAFAAADRVQGKLNHAIVDEVDSILIDEARTPLIISGADEDSSDLYKQINKIIPELEKQEDKDAPGDFNIDEKSKQVFLSEDGHQKVEELLTKIGMLAEGDNLYDAQNIALMHHVQAGLRAHALFRRDVDYIVRENEVVIVDEHTGRTMPGRRWSDGLHQAVEAKEKVAIQNENQTLASITFQNYFRLYNKLSGMTGTADTEAFEFSQIYGLEVVVIPTNRQSQRKDLADLIYITKEEKFAAILEDIEDCVARQQPVLVGTISIETSEFLSKFLAKKQVKHQVLNAKFHEKEAQIVAEAGRPGAVTIATNMAGRGTDIVLGGSLEAELAELDTDDATVIKDTKERWQKRHDQVLAAGGLHIIGTERHESRRIDNQLRGRSGRQGDAGSTRFYLSTKDDLMRIFISDAISRFLNKMHMEEGTAITHPWMNRAIENAQKKVEGHNFDIRKQLLDYDNVANDQRKVIYKQRNELMETEDVSDLIQDMREDVIQDTVANFVPPQSFSEQWDIKGLEQTLEGDFSIDVDLQRRLEKDNTFDASKIHALVAEEITNKIASREANIGNANMRHLEKLLMLNVLDSHWKEHLATMEYLRHSIHLQGYAQKDPKQEYKRQAFQLFGTMLEEIKHEVISLLCKVEISENVEAVDEKMRADYSKQNLECHHPAASAAAGISATPVELPTEATVADGDFDKVETFVRTERKVGRNEACPCGSGMKYKHCHGKL